MTCPPATECRGSSEWHYRPTPTYSHLNNCPMILIMVISESSAIIRIQPLMRLWLISLEYIVSATFSGYRGSHRPSENPNASSVPALCLWTEDDEQ